MKYSQEKLNELSEKVNIVDLIGQTEELSRKGQNYFVKCPFHTNDDTPSLAIYPQTNKWYCFGCNAGSSVYDWIMKKNNISFSEAVETVLRMVGKDIEIYEESESVNFLKKLKKLKNTNNEDIIRQHLDFQKDYLDKYSDEPPEEWLAEDMTKDALKTYGIRIDHNANRIVYPVFDSENNFIGVKGRTRIATYKQLGLAKYMNYYKIGNLDYFQGWQQALPEIKNKKSVIIFEGIKSCIKAWGWNIRNCVASETSKLSDGQVRLLLKTGIPEIIIAWDKDQKYLDIIRDSKIQMLKKFAKVTVVRDINNYLGEKDSPTDKGEEIFKRLLKERC